MASKAKTIEILKRVLIYVTTLVFTYYMNISSWLLVGIVLGFFIDFLQIKLYAYSYEIKNKNDLVATVVFSVILSVVIVAGKHIQIDISNIYAGTHTANYISAYCFADIIAICGIAYFICAIVKSIILLREKYNGKLVEFDISKRVSIKSVVIATIIMMLMWLPYLYVYYPGFYFGDTSSNVIEALGLATLTNHHPVMYILFLRICLNLGFKIGGITQGLAIFSFCQTVFMAIGVSYFLNWVRFKFTINKWIYYLTVLCFGASTYVAQYSIAIWKDPIFSVSVIVFTICFFDAIYGKYDSVLQKIWSYLKLIATSFLVIFSRNNGIYIVLAVIIIMIIAFIYFFLKKEKAWNIARCICVCASIVIISNYVTGPVYDSWGVDKSDTKVESYGIFLNQMARVVVCNGDLSDEEIAYMNAIYPIDDYDETYTPCCVDNLKWNPLFNKAVLEDNFINKYISIAKKNPKICIEAWELQTFGFWAINQKCVNTFEANIDGGVPRNIGVNRAYPLGVEGIELKNVEDDSTAAKMFPHTARDIPVSYMHWLIIALAIFALLRGDWKRFIMLAPALGLMMTLIIASPIWYWPRYGFAQQLILPLLLVLCFTKNEALKTEDEK
ncbi:MAG: DUF6020 family protein [Lachnospiraceae bacterium]|nr:DUF6020 family protein [Lachnospiraceae bacterium]